MRAYVIALTSVLGIAAASPAAAEGFRAEIHGGYDHVSADDDGDGGVVYGIGLGYDFDISENAFVGVDLSIADNTMRNAAPAWSRPITRPASTPVGITTSDSANLEGFRLGAVISMQLVGAPTARSNIAIPTTRMTSAATRCCSAWV